MLNGVVYKGRSQKRRRNGWKFLCAIILEIRQFLKPKLQKLPKNYQNLTFEKMTPMLHNGDVFANTAKNSGNSTMYSY